MEGLTVPLIISCRLADVPRNGRDGFAACGIAPHLEVPAIRILREERKRKRPHTSAESKRVENA